MGRVNAEYGAWVSWSFLVALLLGWEGLVQAELANPLFFSSPSRILSSAPDLLTSSVFMSDLVATLSGFGLALGSALVLGVVLGVGIGRSPLLHRLLNPVVVGINAVPKIVLMPLVVLWFGFGLGSKVFLGAVMAGFPILVNTRTGITSLDADHVQLAQAFGADRRRILRLVVGPSIAPHVLAGLRVGLNYAMVGVLIVEFFAAGEGLGYRMIVTTQNFQTDAFFVLLGVVLALVLSLTAAVGWVESWLGGWRNE